jgi:drug/metabolite transporter (DMT)-like permease
LQFLSFLFFINAIPILPLVEITLILSMSPLYTSVLCYLIFKDKLKPFELICLIASFAGLSGMVIGHQESNS